MWTFCCWLKILHIKITSIWSELYVKCSLLEKNCFCLSKNSWLLDSLSSFSYTKSVTWWYHIKKLICLCCMLHSICYLKLDVSAIFVKKSPVLLVVRVAVMYYRKCHILCKLLLIKNLVFLEIKYQYWTRACQEKKLSYYLSYHMECTIKLL